MRQEFFNITHNKTNMFGTPSRTMMQGGTPGSAKSRSRHGIATRSSIISSGRKTPHG